jgi:hypothetical protein
MRRKSYRSGRPRPTWREFARRILARMTNSAATDQIVYPDGGALVA